MGTSVSTAWPFETGRAPFKVKGIAYAFHDRSVLWERPTPAGVAHGVPVYDVAYQVRWSSR